jgi:hypothetical protein
MENKQAMELIWFLNDDIEYHRSIDYSEKHLHIVASKCIMEDLELHLTSKKNLISMSKKRQLMILTSLATQVMGLVKVVYYFGLNENHFYTEQDKQQFIEDYKKFRFLLELYSNGNTKIPIPLKEAVEYYATILEKGGENG